MNGQTALLAQAVADNNKQEALNAAQAQFQSVFPFASAAAISKALNGAPQELAESVSKHLASQAIVEAKSQLQVSIAKSLKVQASFKALGFGLEPLLLPEKRLSWIPASYAHNETTGSIVYGGVKVEPTSMCKWEADRHSCNLLKPSSAFSNSRFEIDNAKSFVSGLQSSVSPMSCRVDTSAVDRIIRDMQHNIDRAQRDQSRAESEQRKVETAKKQATFHMPADYGFRHIGVGDVPLYESLMNGKVGGASYEIFSSDSVPCAVLKSEINHLYNVSDEDDLHLPTTIRRAATVEKLARQIETECRPATPSDLQTRSYEEKWFFERTPNDILNHYEQVRSQEQAKCKAQSQVPDEFKGRPPMWIPSRLQSRRR